jgi:NAD(P)-dependent dehydrogenase (short-subunit alcohol dehydrogenase family)
MQEFTGRVAVVTGAASGIGLGLARRFAREGMRVVLADVEEEPLRRAHAELEDTGAEALAVVANVRDLASVESLADQAYERFGAVNVLCNNAGVSGGGGFLWETTAQDWEWVLGVNLLGVVHGIRAFVPRMIEGGEPGHIVNTSSVLGLSSGPGSIYGVSKHAVTRLTEGLHHDLQQATDGRIRCSVLCPGMIATRIIEAERNRPAELSNGREPDPEVLERRRMMSEHFQQSGMSPDEVGAIVTQAIRDERFYILTHPDVKDRVRTRMEDILEERTPTPPPQPAPQPAAPQPAP